MAGDVNSNIFINVDTSSAMAQLRALEKELTALNRALVIGTKTAAQAQSKYAQGLLHNVNATGQWTASMTRMRTATEQFSTALDRSKLSLKEYFRYGMASTRTFGRAFGNEYSTVSKLVEKRVKVLQQQYVQLGRDAQGAMNALKFTPKALNYRDVTTQLMMATQRQQIFNKLLDDGSTKLLNFGKNTQWAGRQLMVGFTVPLLLFGSQAIRTFKEIETQMIRFKKVYGDIYTDPGQTEQALKNIRALADEYTKYGVKVADTLKMAADAAAAGNSGKDLEQIVEQTNRLAVLGGVTQEKALETTIALKNAFQVGANDLDQTINFLNAVENQTVVALEDLTEAIPRVAPVVKQLGGDVKDLAFFMAAMQEGGISAAQGANALKSGLGSLINPSKKASEAAAEVGVNIRGIVEANQGNLRNIVVGFAQALQPLTDLQRTRVIEDVFGKYQFARISALLNNVTKEGTQAARVLQLANASVEELAILSERELGVQADSAMNKFAGAVERLKAAVAPIGEIFAKTLTPAIEFITRMFERFNKLPEGIKKGIAVITAVVGGLGPIFLMTFGLLANALANTMKGFNLLRKGYQQLAHGSSDAALKTQYLTNEELENISVTNSLYSTHERLSAAYRIESTALGALIAQYGTATSAMRNFSMANPGLFVPGRVVPPIRRAGGGTVSGPGTSTSDSIPAYLSDGEYVVNAKAVKQYGVDTFDAMNARKYSSGGPVIGKDGIPRLFGGGFYRRILDAMLPKTRLGVVQAGASGYDISGFGTGGRPRVGVVVPPSSARVGGSRPLVFTEDPSGKIKVALRDDPNSFFYIEARKRLSFENSIDSHVVERMSRGDSAEKIYNNFREQMLRNRRSFRGQPILGRTETPSKFLFGLTGYKKSASNAKGAPRHVKDAFEKKAIIFDSTGAKIGYTRTKAGELYQELDNEQEAISRWVRTNVGNLDEKQIAAIERYNRVAVSHLDPADSHLWTPRTGSRDSALINQALNYEKGRFGSGNHITNQQEAQLFLNYLESRYAQLGDTMPGTQLGALQLLRMRLKPDTNGKTFYKRHGIKDTQLNLQYTSVRQNPATKKYYNVDKFGNATTEYAMGGAVQKYAGGTTFVGMPKSFTKVLQTRALAEKLNEAVNASRFKNLPITDTGVKLKDLGGFSVGEISRAVNGVYKHPDGRTVVYKAVESEEAALAEMRMAALMRGGSELKTPMNQSIKVIADPTDLTRKRKILAIESDYDPRFENPTGEFTKKQFIKQTLAAGIRGDKDVKRSNISGDDVIDQGNSGVFGTASSRFKYADSMKTIEEQLLINFGAVKGGASKDFVKAVRKMAKTMGYSAFKNAMLKEIEESIPRYKATINSFKLNPQERKIYDDLVVRLENSKNADWRKVYNAAAGIPGYEDGVFSVPGPKGAGDVVPAMLSPGEAVVPADQSQKYRPLIKSIIADNVPGYAGSNIDDWGDDDTPKRGGSYDRTRVDRFQTRMEAKIDRAADRFVGTRVGGWIDRKVRQKQEREDAARNAARASARAVPMPAFSDLKESIDKNTKAANDSTDASKKNTRGVLQRLGFDRGNLSEAERLERTRGGRGFLRGFAPVADFDRTVTKNGKEKFTLASSAQKTNARQLDRMNRSQRLAMPSMGVAMATSMAGMYAMSNPDKQFMGMNLGQLSGPLMGVSILAGLLPMLNSPIKMLIAGVVGLAAIFKMQSAQIKQSILDGREQGKTLLTTKESLEEFGNITNTVSKTQIAENVRASRTTEIVPVSMDFGKNFILNSDFGKKFQADLQKNIETFGKPIAAQVLGNQLATAVSQKVLTEEQAQSIAIALTRDLKDATFEMQVRGKLIELLGPDGKNVITDPIELQLKLISNKKQIQQETFKNLQEVISRERNGLAGLGGKEALAMGLSTIPAAGAGALATGAMYRGKVVNYNLRRAEELAFKGKRAQQFMAATEMARGSGKLNMAANAVRGLRVGTQIAGAGATATGVGAVPGLTSIILGTVIFGGIEAGLRAWQKGNEKKAIGKAAGIYSGVTTELLKSTQQGLDAMNAQIDDSVKILEAKKRIAKTSQETADLEGQIAVLEQQRAQGINKIYAQQVEILNNLETSFNQIGKSTFFETISPFGTGRGQLRTKFLESFQEGTDLKFKKDPISKMYVERMRKDLQKTESIQGSGGSSSAAAMAYNERQKVASDVITLKIEALINSDVLTAEQAAEVVSNLSGDRVLAQKELETIITVHGTEGLQRMAILQQYIPKEKNKKNLQLMIQSSNRQDANEMMSALEELVKLPSYLGFDINIETQKGDMERLEGVGEEISDLKKMIPNGQISLKILQDVQQKLGGPGKNLTLDAAIAQWETLSKLPKNLQFNAMITLGSIQQSDSFDKILDRELEAAFYKANPTLQMSFVDPEKEKSKKAALAAFKLEQKNIDAATKAYFAKVMPELYGTAVKDTVKTGKGTGDGKGKGPDTSWLSELLQRLKLLKEGSIDATGSMKQLLGQVTKFFGPGLMSSVNPSLDKTRGALLQIEQAAKAAGITLSTEFVDFIEGLDAEKFEEFRDRFLSMSNGKIVGFKGTSSQFFGSDAAYDRRQKAIKAGTFDGSQQSLFGQVNEAFRTKTIAEFIKKQQDSIKESNLQVEAFRKLTDATGEFKFDAMAAMEVLKDPALAKEIALGKKIFSPEEREAIITSINKTYAAASALSKIKMIQDTEGLQNQVKAFDKLSAAGYDYATILKVIENEAYAYEIAKDGVDGLSDSTKALVKDTKNYIDALTTLENTKFFEERTNALKLKQDFAAIAPLLVQAGASLSDIQEILSNPNLAKAFIQELQDGSLDAGRIKEYLDQIPDFKQVDVELRISTREGQEEEFDKLFSKAMEYYDLLEDKIEDDFEPLLKNAQDAIDATQEKIEGINDEIQKYQDEIDVKQRKIEIEITRPIEILQKDSAELANDLELMNVSADEITKKYDEQAEALTKVFEINSRIADQQKQQLNLAGALSQGDISAAAAAAQELKASQSAAMQEDQLGILNTAKQTQIAGLRNKGGLTRLQIEKLQFNTSQKIYELEKKRDLELIEVRKLEDAIYNIKTGRLKLAQNELDLNNKNLKSIQDQKNAAIEAIDKQREIWTDAKLAIGFARIEAGHYNDVIEFSNTLVTLMKDGWLGVGNAILAAVSALALYNAGLKKKPLTFEQAQAQAQNTLGGYLNTFGSKLGSADQQIVGLELKIAEAMEKGEDTSALEAQLAALRASTELLADNMYDVAKTLDKVDNATNIAAINSAVSTATSILKDPFGDIDVEWDGPVWIPEEGSGAAGADFVQVASKGGIIKPSYLKKGGMAKYFLGGGFAKGTDTVPAMLTPGEFVMSRYAVNAHGVEKMRAINGGASIGDSVYNYSISVNVKSDANPDEIARVVMTQIKQVDSKRLRGASL